MINVKRSTEVWGNYVLFKIICILCKVTTTKNWSFISSLNFFFLVKQLFPNLHVQEMLLVVGSTDTESEMSERLSLGTEQLSVPVSKWFLRFWKLFRTLYRNLSFTSCLHFWNPRNQEVASRALSVLLKISSVLENQCVGSFIITSRGIFFIFHVKEERGIVYTDAYREMLKKLERWYWICLCISRSSKEGEG